MALSIHLDEFIGIPRQVGNFLLQRLVRFHLINIAEADNNIRDTDRLQPCNPLDGERICTGGEYLEGSISGQRFTYEPKGSD